MPDDVAEKLIEKIIDYGHERWQAASCVYIYESKQYDKEAAEILAEIRAMLAAKEKGQ